MDFCFSDVILLEFVNYPFIFTKNFICTLNVACLHTHFRIFLECLMCVVGILRPQFPQITCGGSKRHIALVRPFYHSNDIINTNIHTNQLTLSAYFGSSKTRKLTLSKKINISSFFRENSSMYATRWIKLKFNFMHETKM